ncbi:MAG TPA: hypothetical protein VEF53_06360 [Patescibacteria group bacterium]|nr:hypothetical protein [Patescibacteria group bacterium]
MKKPRVKIVEQGNKIILTFSQLSDLKAVRNFEPANSALKVHKANKGKGSYNRNKKHKDRDGEKDTDLCFLFIDRNNYL